MVDFCCIFWLCSAFLKLSPQCNILKESVCLMEVVILVECGAGNWGDSDLLVSVAHCTSREVEVCGEMCSMAESFCP